jgi:predicted PurR-regulated permease PerM
MQLSERQQNTIAIALTILASLVIVFAVLGLFWVFAIFVRNFSHVLLPPALAGIVALVFQPYFELLRTRLRLPIPAAIAALFLSILIPIGMFIGFFGLVITQQLMEFIDQLPGLWESLLARIELYMPEIKAFFTEHPVGKRLAQILEGSGPMVVAGLESFATTSAKATTSLAGWTGALLGWAVAPVYFVFFLIMKRKDISQLDDYLPFLKKETRDDVVFLVQEFVNIVVAFFRGQIIIAFLQGVLLAIGFSIVKLDYGLVLGLLLGFLNLIPYLGSMLGLVITLPLAFFQPEGGMFTLVGVIVVLLIVQMIEGYLLTPKIMGDRTGLHPMAIIFAVFFWGSALGGILGMILAIPLTAFLVVFWRLAKEKYISELV